MTDNTNPENDESFENTTQVSSPKDVDVSSVAENVASEEFADVTKSVSEENTVTADSSNESSTISNEPDTLFVSLNDIIQQLSNLDSKIEIMNKLFADRIRYTEHDENIVKQMHSELQAYKDDLYAKLVKPILLDVIDFRENILKVATAYRNKPEGQQDIPNHVFADYAEDVSAILERYDVEISQSSPGDACISLQQKIIKTIPTHNESLHKKIAESKGSKYTLNGRTIYTERVYVYAYEKPTVVETPAEKQTDTVIEESVSNQNKSDSHVEPGWIE